MSMRILYDTTKVNNDFICQNSFYMYKHNEYQFIVIYDIVLFVFVL